MKKVLLIDVDSKIPNLALMQLSAYHKSRGDIVGFHVSDPDIVYASVIFTKNKHLTDGLKFQFPNAQIHIGGSGSGNFIKIPEGAQKIMPDYSLYPDLDYSIGFTTRGCIRSCDFCIVRSKEGKYHKWQHVKEFHNPEFDKVMLLDNTWTANKKWFFENSNWIIKNNLKVNPCQGIDVRILVQETAEQLKAMKWDGCLHIAWDNMKDEAAVLKGLDLLENAGFNLRSNIQVYVLIDFNTTKAEDIHRCNTLKERGTNPFIMPYQQIDDTYSKPLGGKHVKHMARWGNKKELFWSMPFSEYKKARFSKTQTKIM